MEIKNAYEFLNPSIYDNTCSPNCVEKDSDCCCGRDYRAGPKPKLTVVV